MYEPDFEDDRETVVESARLPARRVAPLLPVVLIVGVIVAASLGSKAVAPPNPPSGPPSQDVQALQATAVPTTTSLNATPTGLPVAVLPGYTSFVADGQVRSVALPPDTYVGTLATAARRLYYVSGTYRIDAVDIQDGATPETLVAVQPCLGIDQLAVAGSSLLYVVVKPVGTPLDGNGCGSEALVDWQIWRMDLGTKTEEMLASGSHATSPDRAGSAPVHIAVTPFQYAFERDLLPGGSRVAIEVHSFDGSPGWTTTLDSPVRSLMLGSGRLAVVTDDAIPQLATAEPGDRSPHVLAKPAGGASLSPDGTYLTWDQVDARHPSRMTVMLQVRGATARSIATMPRSLAPPRPVVSESVGGPEVAWFAAIAHGLIAPAFVDLTHPNGGVFVADQPAAWLAFSGDDLVWVYPGGSGVGPRAYAVDLPTLVAAAAP